MCLSQERSGLIYYLTAICVIGTGTSYPSLSRAVGPKTLKICINHGAGPRSTNAVDGKLIKNQQKLIQMLNKFDYLILLVKPVDFNDKLQYLLPENKRIVFGYPRCDHLLNSPRLEKKRYLNQIITSLDKKDKVILYSPTWKFFDHSISFRCQK